MLGVHWIADAAECAADRFDAAKIREVLIELPARLGLRRVSEPLVFHSPDGHEGPTLAGIVLLAESHASLHLFPETGALHADVFSCRPIDVQLARDFVARAFGAKVIRDRVVERG